MSRRARAYHEAGHVIAGQRFGWTVEIITIEPSQDSGGRAEFGPMSSLADLAPGLKRAAQQQRMVERMVMYGAGPIAQRRAAPRSRVPAGAVKDHAEVERLAMLLSTSPQGERALVRHVEHEARSLVQRNWPIIAAIAAALVERTTLTGAEVDAITAPIEAAEAMEARAYLARYGLPTDEQIELHRAERQARSRTVERRHIAEAVLRTVIRRMGTGNQTPLSADDLDAAVRDHAVSAGLDADVAAAKLWSTYARQQQALRWRRVEPVISTISARRH
jgi:hypothetical protein